MSNNQQTKKRETPALMPISMRKLRQNDILERLKFAYTVSPRNFRRVFEKVGIKITGPDDLVVLADLHESGRDRAGFKGSNGQIYAFNVEEILNRPYKHPDSIKVTRRMVAGAPIKWVDLVVHQGRVKIIK